MSNKNKFLDTPEGKEYLIKNYVEGNKTATEIKKELGLKYNNVIYRALRRWGLPRKNKAEAQANYLAKNPGLHPTLGKPRDHEVKKKIGNEMHNYWEEMPDDEMQRRLDKSREIWYNRPEELREEWNKKSHIGIRKAAQEGSRFEKYLVAALLSKNYKLQVHKKFLFDESEMSVDIFLTIQGIVIECDSVFHCNPIWGGNYLKNRVEKDLLKNELLMSSGYSLIRIANPRGYCSKTVFEKFTNKFLVFLKEVAEKEVNTYHEILLDDFIAE